MYLVGTLPDGTSFRHPVPPGRFCVGRGQENGIILSHASISRHHAEIERIAADRLRVRDLNSTNGTRIDGQLISETEVSLPCRIFFGDLPCALEVDGRAPIIVPKPRNEADFDDSTVTPWPLPAPPPASVGAARTLVRTVTVLGATAALTWFLWGPGGIRETASAKSPSLRATRQTVPLANLASNRQPPAVLPASTPAPVAESADQAPTPAPATTSADSSVAPSGAETLAPLPLLANVENPLTGTGEVGKAQAVRTAVIVVPVPAPAPSGDTPTPGPAPASEKLSETVASGPEGCSCEDDDPVSDPRPAARAAMPGIAGVPQPQAQPQVQPAPEPKPDSARKASATRNRPAAPTAQPPPQRLMLALSSEKVSLGAPITFPNHEVFEPRPQGNSLTSASPRPIPRAAPVVHLGAVNTLVLGDSLSLCGFGPRLDEHFRESGFSKSTYTYMACGTIPLTWLKAKPYSAARTLCGFWSIETDPTGGVAKSLKDVYGMKHGYKPAAHLIPKLEDLLAQTHPDVLVIQTGTNFFSLFHGSTQLEHQVPELKRHFQPFLDVALGPGSPVRKIYWVGAPTSGAAAPEVQSYVFQLLQSELPPIVTLIDSRSLISYPYKHMEPDHEHFTGEDMDVWADKVYSQISADLKEHGLPSAKEVEGLRIAATKPAGTQAKPETADEVVVTAQLAFKSTPLPIEQVKPYPESLVSFVYNVQSIQHGDYTERQILVMRPAHIGLQPQPLDRYKVGKTYKLRLHELEGSAWRTIKAADDSGLINLIPYIEVDDEARLPSRSST